MPDQVIGRSSVEVEADLTAFDRGLGEARSKLDNFDRSAQSTTRAVNAFEGATQGSARALQSLGSSASGTADQNNKLVAQSAAYTRVLQEQDALIQRTVNRQKELAVAVTDTGRAHGSMAGKADGAKRALDSTIDGLMTAVKAWSAIKIAVLVAQGAFGTLAFKSAKSAVMDLTAAALGIPAPLRDADKMLNTLGTSIVGVFGKGTGLAASGLTKAAEGVAAAASNATVMSAAAAVGLKNIDQAGANVATTMTRASAGLGMASASAKGFEAAGLASIGSVLKWASLVLGVLATLDAIANAGDKIFKQLIDISTKAREAGVSPEELQRQELTAKALGVTNEQYKKIKEQVVAIDASSEKVAGRRFMEQFFPAALVTRVVTTADVFKSIQDRADKITKNQIFSNKDVEYAEDLKRRLDDASATLANKWRPVMTDIANLGLMFKENWASSVLTAAQISGWFVSAYEAAKGLVNLPKTNVEAENARQIALGRDISERGKPRRKMSGLGASLAEPLLDQLTIGSLTAAQKEEFRLIGQREEARQKLIEGMGKEGAAYQQLGVLLENYNKTHMARNAASEAQAKRAMDSQAGLVSAAQTLFNNEKNFETEALERKRAALAFEANANAEILRNRAQQLIAEQLIGTQLEASRRAADEFAKTGDQKAGALAAMLTPLEELAKGYADGKAEEALKTFSEQVSTIGDAAIGNTPAIVALAQALLALVAASASASKGAGDLTALGAFFNNLPGSKEGVKNRGLVTTPKAPKASGSNEDTWEKEIERIRKHTSQLIADTAAVGLGVGAREALRQEMRLLTAAQKENDNVTDDQVDKYAMLRGAGKSVADALKEAGIELGKNGQKMAEVSERTRELKQNLEELQAGSKIRFEIQTTFFSDTEKKVAEEMYRLKGNEWTKHMDSPLAGLIRLRDGLNDLKQATSEFGVNFYRDMKAGESATKALNNALGKMLDRLAESAIKKVSDNLLSALLSPLAAAAGGAGGLGGLFGKLFGGVGNATGAEAVAFGGSVPDTTAAAEFAAMGFHTGGIVGAGGSPRSVDRRAFGSAQRFRRGGIPGLGPDEIPAILHRREEVITQRDPRHRWNGGLLQSSPPPVSLVINNNSSVPMSGEQRETTDSRGGRSIELTIDDMIGGLANKRGTQTSNVLSSRGARPPLNRR